MIGIDIVDTADPLLRTRCKSHLRFIRHPDDHSMDQDDFWGFWAAKEAVFKARRKIQQFDPRKIPVQFITQKSGIDSFTSSFGISGFLENRQDLILAIASDQFINIHFEVKEIETKNPSLAVRKWFSQWYSRTFGTKVAIQSDQQGLPFLDGQNMEISFSHHGRFLAFGLKTG